MEDVHGLEDAVAAQDHEIVGFYLNVVADHIRDAAEVGLQFALHLVLVILDGFVLELPEASGKSALAHQSIVLHEASCAFDAISLVSSRLDKVRSTGK